MSTSKKRKYNKIACINQKLAKYNAAINALKKSIKYSSFEKGLPYTSSKWYGWYKIGKIYYENLKAYDKAIRAYTTAIKLYKECSVPKSHLIACLCRCYDKLHRYKKVESLLQSLINDKDERSFSEAVVVLVRILGDLIRDDKNVGQKFFITNYGRWDQRLKTFITYFKAIHGEHPYLFSASSNTYARLNLGLNFTLMDEGKLDQHMQLRTLNIFTWSGGKIKMIVNNKLEDDEVMLSCK